MTKNVVLEGCFGDWSKKSYFRVLAEKANEGTIKLYAVDKKDIKENLDVLKILCDVGIEINEIIKILHFSCKSKDEIKKILHDAGIKDMEEDEIKKILHDAGISNKKKDAYKIENHKTPIEFVKSGSKKWEKDIENIDFVFIVAPHEFHCAIACHWLGKLNENGQIFIEKPLDSSIKNIENLIEGYGMEELNEKITIIDKLNKKITIIDHYIPKIHTLIGKLECKKSEKEKKYGKIKMIRINILESNPILESRKKTLNEGLILDMFPHVLAVLTKIMRTYSKSDNNDNEFTLNAGNVDIIDVKTSRYKFAPIAGETFAKIIAKIDKVGIESYIGKAVDFHDNKRMEILFEEGSIKVDLISGNIFTRTRKKKDEDDKLQKKYIGDLLNDIINGKEFSSESLAFNEGYEIVKIISRIREKAGYPSQYEKFASPNEILAKSEKFDERDRTVIDVLLKQYDFLRDEITRCIYLEHVAVLGLYTSLGVIIATLTGELIKRDFEIVKVVISLNFDRIVLFLFALIFVQIIANGFGSLFLKEQARNRRACSFVKAIEYLINEKIGEIGIYWENYITSRLIDRRPKLRKYFYFKIPINPQYYKNRWLSVGLPIFLPNLFITYSIEFMGVLSLSQALDERTVVFIVFFIISFMITIMWALMIIYQVFSPLGKEKVPAREEVLEWLEEENLTLLWS